jgi:aldose 1-epimerase
LAKVQVPQGNFPLIHGLVRDETWQFKTNKNTLTTWIDITPRFKYWDCWPWPSRLTLKYTLKTNRVRIDYTVANFDKTELGFGFGLHPLFKNAQSLKVPAKYVMESDKDLLPTGKLFKADLNQLTPVKELNLDHVYTGLPANATRQALQAGEKEKFTCVESQTCSTDAHNLDNRGFIKQAHLIKVKPGGIHHGWVEYRLVQKSCKHFRLW